MLYVDQLTDSLCLRTRPSILLLPILTLFQVVAHNYDEEVHKVKKDAVVFFYAPWCGHCKEFDPVYKKVAKKMLKNNENIVFAKMDGSANDIPYMFPPLKVY